MKYQARICWKDYEFRTEYSNSNMHIRIYACICVTYGMNVCYVCKICMYVRNQVYMYVFIKYVCDSKYDCCYIGKLSTKRQNDGICFDSRSFTPISAQGDDCYSKKNKTGLGLGLGLGLGRFHV